MRGNILRCVEGILAIIIFDENEKGVFMLSRISLLIVVLFSLFYFSLANAETVAVNMYRVAKTGHGSSVGSVTLTDTQYGLLIKPNLRGLPPGRIHGLHIHVNPDCSNKGEAAGGHLDPANTGKHLGPYNPNGHLGDLPALTVEKNGTATLPILAPRLKVKNLIGHSLMIHAGGDNYSDHPKELGGGGARIACGIVK
ncbi:superoxide dismutase family protein [Coxiella burnetii]|uniref:superoxide dismutase family protein n=1 Tax=Coxiella burnetii TaxID=777 RepID=UPI0009B6D00D|nr:superoxide dismutase family protein [Coxiella burnetii]PHH58003.1 superoxide dismutase [Coxiella burnetii]